LSNVEPSAWRIVAMGREIHESGEGPEEDEEDEFDEDEECVNSSAAAKPAECRRTRAAR